MKDCFENRNFLDFYFHLFENLISNWFHIKPIKVSKNSISWLEEFVSKQCWYLIKLNPKFNQWWEILFIVFMEEISRNVHYRPNLNFFISRPWQYSKFYYFLINEAILWNQTFEKKRSLIREMQQITKKTFSSFMFNWIRTTAIVFFPMHFFIIEN